MVDQPSPLLLFWFTRYNKYEQEKQNEENKRKAKRAAGIEGQVATMLELHTRQVYTVDATAIKRARKNEKEQLRGDKAEVPPWDGQQ